MAASIASSFAGLRISAAVSAHSKQPASFSQPSCNPSLNRSRRIIQCQSDSYANGNDDQTVNSTRRQTIVSLTAASTFGVLCNVPLANDANAADLVERIQRGEFLTIVQSKLRTAVNANSELVPSLLRLALNDALTYDKATKTGGTNGSIRFSEELKRPENNGLEKALELLGSVKEEIDAETKGGPISWADIIQFGAQAAVKRSFLESAIQTAGGDEKKGRQLAAVFGSSSQWGFFDKQLGRADATEADPAGRVPDWSSTSVDEWKEKFAQYGLKPRQLTVLAPFLGPDQAAIEEKLVADKDAAPFVVKYNKSKDSVSQTDYQVDLITTFSKVAQFGATINYEAYTYVRPRPKLRF